jgi:hypothetical protein
MDFKATSQPSDSLGFEDNTMTKNFSAPNDNEYQSFMGSARGKHRILLESYFSENGIDDDSINNYFEKSDEEWKQFEETDYEYGKKMEIMREQLKIKQEQSLKPKKEPVKKEKMEDEDEEEPKKKPKKGKF